MVHELPSTGFYISANFVNLKSRNHKLRSILL